MNNNRTIFFVIISILVVGLLVVSYFLVQKSNENEEMAILFEIEKDANESGEFYSAEKRMWMEDMIKMVLFQEMFRRRSTGRNMWY